MIHTYCCLPHSSSPHPHTISTKENVSTQQAAQTLQLLASRHIDCQQELAQYSPSDIPSCFDEEVDTESPIYDTFFQSGKSESIHAMTNFSNSEFHRIWNYCSEYIKSGWNTRRGEKSTHKPKDFFFMLLTLCKNGGQWDFVGRMFNIKGPTFERTVMKMWSGSQTLFYTKLVSNKLDEWTMKKLVSENKLFKTFKFAKYATDVTFQQANRPSGNVDEGKKYYSGKHKLYGYKVEVSVLPNSLAVGCSDHYPGGVPDIDIFYKHICFHKVAAEKKEEERDIVDVGTLVHAFPDHWAVLLDKGYQGIGEIFGAINPHKKRRNNFLTAEEEVYNKKVSSDRIIVENFFGRLCGLWCLMSYKRRWSESSYDMFFKFCLALTNIHILMHPVCDDDAELYQKFKARQYIIGLDVVVKRKRTQEKYRAKRRRPLAMDFVEECDTDSDAETIKPY